MNICWKIMVFVVVSQFTMNAFSESGGEGPQQDMLEWGEAKEGFILSIDMKSQEVDYEEQAIVIMRIKNVSGKERVLLEMRPQRDYSFIVKDSKGESVPLLRYQQKILDNALVIIGRSSTTMAPGQIIEYRMNLSRCYDLSLAGKYIIQAKTTVPRLNGGSGVSLVSNVDTITIRR
jgi:hypothetical protein